MGPAAVPIIMVTATVVSTGLAVYGQMRAAKQEQALHEYNVGMAESEASYAKQEAKFLESQHRRDAQRLMAEQRARYGAAGVELGAGSPLLVMGETAAEAELDALAIRYGGQIKQQRYYAQSALDRWRGGQALTSGYFRAGRSLLTGGTRIARMLEK